MQALPCFIIDIAVNTSESVTYGALLCCENCEIAKRRQITFLIPKLSSNS